MLNDGIISETHAGLRSKHFGDPRVRVAVAIRGGRIAGLMDLNLEVCSGTSTEGEAHILAIKQARRGGQSCGFLKSEGVGRSARVKVRNQGDSARCRRWVHCLTGERLISCPHIPRVGIKIDQVEGVISERDLSLAEGTGDRG